MSDLKTYTPKLIEESPLKLDKQSTSYNNKLSSIANKDGVIEVQLEEKVVKQRIAKDLYSGYTSGIRELYNNEARACREAKKLGAKNPRIEVTVDPSEKKLIIHGRDSLGISVEVFDKVLRRLGVSGNLSGNEVGQFGFGFASYTTLSDLVMVDTFARETDEKYSFMGKNGIDLQILPQPEMKEYGTKLSLTYDDKVEEDELLNVIVNLARFSHVPTKLILKDEIDRNEFCDIPDGNYENAGEYELKQFDSYEKYCQYMLREGIKGNVYHFHFYGDKELKWKIPIHIENDDYEFYGIIACSDAKSNWNEPQIITSVASDVLLLGTPIISGIQLGDFSVCVLNIKNERKFPPTADRDRLTDEASEKIESAVREELGKYFTAYSIKTFKDYLESDYKELFNTTHIKDSDSIRVNSFLSTYVYSEKGDKYGAPLRRVLLLNGHKYDELIVIRKLDNVVISKLKNYHSNAYIFRVSETNRRIIPQMEECGIIDGNKFLKDKKIKINRFINANGNREYVIHESHTGTSGWGYVPEIRKTTRRMEYKTLKSQPRVLQAEGEELQNVFQVLSQTLSGYLVVRKHKGLVGIENMEDLCKRVENDEVYTNLGKMKLHEIKGNIKLDKVTVLCYEFPEIALRLKTPDTAYIVAEDFNKTFEVCCYLIGKKELEFDSGGEKVRAFMKKQMKEIASYGRSHYWVEYNLDLIYASYKLSKEVRELFILGVSTGRKETKDVLKKALKVEEIIRSKKKC